ncbi:membrane protein [Bifidobacterium magnum]|uniref:membrane protein n=1 Tax=Bifidobacterium magnum TaxID=1692 RepID=UPI0003B48E51|nr:membrane protein [Bifidobacterium magnum]
MPNRAERRAQQKRDRGGVPQQYDSTKGRGRSGMLDEAQLQERSRRVKEGSSESWKPTSSVIEASDAHGLAEVELKDDSEKVFKAPHSVRQVFRMITWIVIVLSAIAFFVVMWLPNHPMWLIITVSAIFAAGVLSLFFDAGDWRNNPNLDQNGTAV